MFCVYVTWQFKKTGFEPWMPIDMLFSVGIVASILNFLALKKNFRLSIKIVKLGLNLPFVLSLVLIFSILFSSNKPPQLIPLDDTRGSYTLRKRGSDYFVKYIPSGDKKTFIDCPLFIGCEVGAIGGNWFGQFVEKNVITVEGIDKHLVGETAAQIRAIKKPEPYKGKGIKYLTEVIRRKAGKTAAKSA
jgi:hypothetical protein